MILGFYPNENPKFGRYLEEIVDDLGKSSFRIVEEINEEFQIELQLKNERSHNETIEVHCVAGQHYDFKELESKSPKLHKKAPFSPGFSQNGSQIKIDYRNIFQE